MPLCSQSVNAYQSLCIGNTSHLAKNYSPAMERAYPRYIRLIQKTTGPAFEFLRILAIRVNYLCVWRWVLQHIYCNPALIWEYEEIND